jgi:TPR repeat protein
MQNQLNEKHASPVPVKMSVQSMTHEQRDNRKSMTAVGGKLIDIKGWLKHTHLDCKKMIKFLTRERPQLELSHKLADEFRYLSQSIIICLNSDAMEFGKYCIRGQLCSMDQAIRMSIESLSRSSRSQPISEIIKNWLDTKSSISQDMYEKCFSNNNQEECFTSFSRSFRKFYALLLEVTASAYKHGRYMPVDYGRSLTLYHQAADMGSAYAKNSLGCFYSDDELGIERDNKRAFGLFKESVDGGNKQANINLATMHANGWGTQKNYEKAVSLYASFLKKDKVKVKVLPLMTELRARSDIGKKLKRKIYKILLKCRSESTPEVYHALAQINLHHMPLLNKYQKKGLTYLRLAKCQGYQPAIDELKEIERETSRKKKLSKQQRRSVERLSQPRSDRKYMRP